MEKNQQHTVFNKKTKIKYSVNEIRVDALFLIIKI
jgi:hypothetical protein